MAWPQLMDPRPAPLVLERAELEHIVAHVRRSALREGFCYGVVGGILALPIVLAIVRWVIENP